VIFIYDYTKQRNQRNNFFSKFLLIAFITVIIFFCISFFKLMDNRLLPHVIAEIDMILKTKINVAIDDAVKNVVNKKDLISDNFYKTVSNNENKITSLYVDTILINELCNEVAVRISENLNETSSENISVPLGVITNIKIFANKGPKYTISVKPIGNATADYETSFENVGINQINFQVWLIIESEIQVVNPMQESKINVSRRVPLVNTIISRETPTTHFFNQSISE